MEDKRFLWMCESFLIYIKWTLRIFLLFCKVRSKLVAHVEVWLPEQPIKHLLILSDKHITDTILGNYFHLWPRDYLYGNLVMCSGIFRNLQNRYKQPYHRTCLWSWNLLLEGIWDFRPSGYKNVGKWREKTYTSLK